MLTVLWQTKTSVSFPLEDTHLLSKHHVIRKSHDAPQEKCPHVVFFNVPRDWFETNSRHPTRYPEGGKKKWLSRSTGKSNIVQTKKLSEIRW